MTDEEAVEVERTVQSERAEVDRPAGTGGQTARDRRDRPVGLTGDDARTTVLRAALVALSLVALVALWGFYTSVDTAIGVWVADRYRAAVRAAFNLALLLGTGVGLSLVVRELSEDGDGSGPADGER